MIIFEFSDFMVRTGRVPAQLCQLNGKPITKRTSRHSYLALAERVYLLEGTTAKVIKDRYREPKDFYISREDAVALVLKAVVL